MTGGVVGFMLHKYVEQKKQTEKVLALAREKEAIEIKKLEALFVSLFVGSHTDKRQVI